MKYDKSYCEEKGISTSNLTEAQSTLYYIAENMKMAKSISEEGYKHINMAIKALEQGDVIDKIRAEIERLHYHPKLDFIKNDEVVDMALDIIDMYRKSEGE